MFVIGRSFGDDAIAVETRLSEYRCDVGSVGKRDNATFLVQILNNAFTNNDYTDFYITLPCDNLETALWLESDRMTGLNLSTEACEIEKRVVIEEFRQRYINQPYGDLNMLLRDMVYTSHPYRWATIGLTPDHIAEAGRCSTCPAPAGGHL